MRQTLIALIAATGFSISGASAAETTYPTNANYGQCKKAVAEAQNPTKPGNEKVAEGTYKGFSSETECKATFTSTNTSTKK